jgi:membrane protease YdiL (CAAX protease family)
MMPGGLAEVADVGTAGLFHLAWFGLVVPLFVIRSKRLLDQGLELPPFTPHILSAILQLGAFALLSLGVAHLEGLRLFVAAWPGPDDWLAGGALLGTAILIMRPRWQKAVAEGQPVVRLFSPRDRRERALWTIASAVAGVSEELTWRGVQFGLLWMLTGQPLVAALVCAVMFGAAHYVQGHQASVAIVPFALAFQLLVLYTGSLYVAMVVHFLYDLIAGFSYGRLASAAGRGNQS